MTISDDTPDAGANFVEVHLQNNFVEVHLQNNEELRLSIHSSGLHVPISEAEPSGGCCSFRCLLPGWFARELKFLLKFAWPIVLFCLLQQVTVTIATIFCGRLGTSVFAGVSLAISLINITCLSVSQGMASACDTLFTQAFGSANKKLLGVFLQRGLIILFLASFVVIALILNGETIFFTIGENPTVSRVAGEYLLLFVPGAIAMFIFIVLSRYILSQNLVMPLIVIVTLGDIVDAVAHYLLIDYAELGHHGSAIALSLTHIGMAIFTVIYLLASKMYEPTWSGWSVAAFYDWGMFMKLAIPGLFMVSLDYFVYELGIIFSALLGDVYVSALAVIFQICTTMSQCYLGIGIGVCIRVGQHLGAGDGVGARQTCITAYTFTIPVVVIASCVFAGLPQYLATIFTNEPAVIELVAGTLPYAPAVYQILNAFNQVSSGILRGSGRQTLGMLAIILPYFLVGLPIAITTMMLTNMNINGFFTGMTMGMLIECVFILAAIIRTKWDREIEKAALNTKTSDDDIISEKTSLLFDSTRNDSEYGAVEVTGEKLMSERSTCRLRLKRLAAFVVILLILAAAILIRFYVKVSNDHSPDDCLYWGNCNSTTVFPEPKNFTKELLFGVFS